MHFNTPSLSISERDSFSSLFSAPGKNLTAGFAGGALEEPLAALFNNVCRRGNVLFHETSPLVCYPGAKDGSKHNVIYISILLKLVKYTTHYFFKRVPVSHAPRDSRRENGLCTGRGMLSTDASFSRARRTNAGRFAGWPSRTLCHYRAP